MAKRSPLAHNHNIWSTVYVSSPGAIYSPQLQELCFLCHFQLLFMSLRFLFSPTFKPVTEIIRGRGRVPKREKTMLSDCVRCRIWNSLDKIWNDMRLIALALYKRFSQSFALLAHISSCAVAMNQKTIAATTACRKALCRRKHRSRLVSPQKPHWAWPNPCRFKNSSSYAKRISIRTLKEKSSCGGRRTGSNCNYTWTRDQISDSKVLRAPSL